MATVKLTGYRCGRCGHTWLPRYRRKPKVCPQCGSPDWNRSGKPKARRRQAARKRRR